MFSVGDSGWLGRGNSLNWREYAIIDFGFWIPIHDGLANPKGLFSLEAVRMLTYPLIHSSFLSASFSVVLILALGNLLARLVSWHDILLIFFTASVAGSLGFFLAHSSGLLIGSLPGAFGMMGALCLLSWTTPKVPEQTRMLAVLLPLVLAGSHLLLWIAVGGNLYWIAYVFGFIGGALAFAFSKPGGFRRLAVLLGTIRAMIGRR